jgi:biuret amidohydrolase
MTAQPIIYGRAAVLVIDMQRNFIDDGAVSFCPGGQATVPKIKELLIHARKAGIPVIFTKEIHRKNRIDFGRERDCSRPEHCLEGTPAVEVVNELKPEPEDYVITKRRFSAFFGTELEVILAGLGIKPDDTLILTGVATNVCVHYTAVDAYQRNYRIRVVEDCVAGRSLEAHEAALKAIKWIQWDGIVSQASVLEAIKCYRR